MTKIALKIAYIGTKYFGSQRQTFFSTIDGEIINVLESLNLINKNDPNFYVSCCRTDSKVHALSYIVCFYTDKKILPYSKIINSKLIKKDIFVYSHAYVESDFNPRYNSISRTYCYTLLNDENYDIEYIKECSKLFIGEHDFINFSKHDKNNKNTIRVINRIDIEADKKYIFFKVEANSFLWNMVRKIVSFLSLVGKHIYSIEDIKIILNSKDMNLNIKPSNPNGLILLDVKYK